MGSFPAHPYAAYVTGSLADPVGPNALATATMWIEHTILGTLATTLATIAVSAVGFMMLAGKVNVRTGATVIVGCFILFGAPTIVVGIRSFVGDAGAGAPSHASEPPPPAAPRVDPQPVQMPALDDPYAGASVPAR